MRVLAIAQTRRFNLRNTVADFAILYLIDSEGDSDGQDGHDAEHEPQPVYIDL